MSKIEQTRLYPAATAFYCQYMPALTEIARKHGYALGVHGSMATDLDLIAVPWTKDASEAELLVEALRAEVDGVIPNEPERDRHLEIFHNPIRRPHGRRCWSIHLGTPLFACPWIDLSVMPRSEEGPIQWRGQEDEWGCVIACCAMVMGRTYQEVKADFKSFDGKGICHEDAYEYLADNGFAVGRKFKGRNYAHPPEDKYNYEKEWRKEWPPAPFSDVHLCMVQCYAGGPGHSVVMLGDGTIFDPLTPEGKRLSDYAAVINVAAIVAFRVLQP